MTAMTHTPAITDPDALIMCITCGFQPDGGRGLVVDDDLPDRDAYREHGHTDTAHKPNWMLDPDSPYELVNVADLAEGDVLGTGETVHAVHHVTDPIEDWPDTEDGQTSVRTDVRTGKVGWPGGNRIVRRKQA